MTISAKATYAAERQAMADEIRAMGSANLPAINEDVLAAMQSVPRHLFIPDHEACDAYANSPQRIGHGQTISQPYIVALMTSLAGITPESRVLEVGTGSGYQAAILASLSQHVFSIETILELANTAKANLQRANFRDVSVSVGDGHDGLEENAPFDAIVVTAAASFVPPALTAQLAPGGRLVIPIGKDHQVLTLIQKDGEGVLLHRQIIPVRFVPLVPNTSSCHAIQE